MDLLSDSAEQVWEGSSHEAVRSTGSSKLLFYNLHFRRVTVPRPTGVAILSAPVLSVCKLFSFGTMFTPTLHHAVKVYTRLWSKEEFGPMYLLFHLRSDTDISLHTRITGTERKTLLSSCQV